MADITAKDIQRLRQQMGVGMLDARRALMENDGDFEAARRWLQEKGIAKAAERADRENIQGTVAAARADRAAALVQVRCETDFTAKSPDIVKLAQEVADAAAADGEEAAARFASRVDELRLSVRENIEIGQVVRFEAADGNVLDTYLHIQNDRGVNGVLVELAGGSSDLAHDVAVHIAFARPSAVSRRDVPESDVTDQRGLLENQTRNEGKPEQALPKIVEGKLNGWFKRVPGGVLLDQPYARDEKQSVSQMLGAATVVRFVQVEIGA